MIRLKGEQVRLRALEDSDLDILMDWENDPEQWSVSGTISPYSRTSIQNFIDQSHLSVFQTGQLRLMIDLLDSGKTVGSIDLFEFDSFHRRAGVGILIADKDHRGQNLASESLRLLLDYSLKHLGLHQLFCNILVDNEASLKLFKKAGFEIRGEKLDWVRHNESYKNEYFLQFIKSQ